MIRLLAIQKEKRILAITVAATALMLVIYPYVQSFGQVDLWYAVITPWNLALFLGFSVLFGLMVSLQAKTLRSRTCNLKQSGKSGAAGLAGTVGGFLVIQCPSCALFLSIFLPFNAVIFIATYNTWLTLGSIVLMLVAVHLLGGFKR
ncbi:MAG: hypothetical protein HY369_03895 [Candidatus Aenigmarchaeota archaeon]|nr:hypothetical protein [Candidatus Aenigmarchaeota archaeon]